MLSQLKALPYEDFQEELAMLATSLLLPQLAPHNGVFLAFFSDLVLPIQVSEVDVLQADGLVMWASGFPLPNIGKKKKITVFYL